MWDHLLNEFLNKRSQTAFENGYHGCGNKEASSTILLGRDKEYILDLLRKSLLQVHPVYQCGN